MPRLLMLTHLQSAPTSLLRSPLPLLTSLHLPTSPSFHACVYKQHIIRHAYPREDHIPALSETRHPLPMTIMSSDSSAALKRERDTGEQTVVAVERPVYDQLLNSRLGAIR